MTTDTARSITLKKIRWTQFTTANKRSSSLSKFFTAGKDVDIARMWGVTALLRESYVMITAPG